MLDFARYDGTSGLLPAHELRGIRPPRVFTRWVLARLRHHRFDPVAQVDAAITERLSRVNDRPFQKLPGCHASVLAELDAPALMALPRRPYSLARFKTVKVHIDRHLELEVHRYSVPHAPVS